MQIFTQTVEDGIAPYHGDFSFDSFKSFHSFRTKEVAGDKMVAFTTAAQAAALAEKGPVFLKLFEEWCPHCKKMKKHFKELSNEVGDVTMMEVECSKTKESQGFCAKIGSTGYPTVKVYHKGKTAKYSGARVLSAMKEYLEKKDFDYDGSVDGITADAQIEAPSTSPTPPTPTPTPPKKEAAKPAAAATASTGAIPSGLDAKLDLILTRIAAIETKLLELSS
jgi:thiol-disulfide isomerase/thioredoxin